MIVLEKWDKVNNRLSTWWWNVCTSKNKTDYGVVFPFVDVGNDVVEEWGGRSTKMTVEFDDERLATLFILRWA